MEENTVPSAPKFGTFLGVYTPSILTILGLVMYLRFGWVVGNVGLAYTCGIVLLASSITFITGLSASAIATNIQVGVGGEYFLVSRSLGLEPGGAIGIPLYLCRTLSVTFYCFGLAEAILILWPMSWGPMPSYGIQVFAAFLIIVVTLLSGKSATLVLKAQIPIMILVGLSILALVANILLNDLRAPEWTPTYRTAPEGFWYVFAVFFPAVTGFTAGIGMSGDLREPRKSIPAGTLGAVVTGVIIYLLIPLLFSITALITLDRLADPTAGVATWTEVALLGSVFVIPAVWGAILSSAFGSILGGPRVLQALSMDGLAPKFLSRLSKTGQPTLATWISGVIALFAVGLGELNTVAQFVSVLFLTLYVAINLSAALETLVAEPSYRPKIKVPWYVSALGAVGAIAVMALISPLACMAALGLEGILLFWLFSRSFTQKWGDVAAGLWMNVARYALLRLGAREIHPRNWRPMLLLFVKDIDKRIQVVKLAAALGQNRGVFTIVQLVASVEHITVEERYQKQVAMRGQLKGHGLQAFCEVNSVEDLNNGMLHVAKSHGLAGLKTNMVMFGWSEDPRGQKNQLRIVRGLSLRGKNIIIVRFNQPMQEKYERIDIWWGGKERNGDLMLLLAYLLKLNIAWSSAEITIRSVVRDKAEQARLISSIISMLPKARIQASIEIILQAECNFEDALMEKSRDADLVFLGLPLPQEGQNEELARRLEQMSLGLKTTVFVRNNDALDKIPGLLQS